MRRTGWLNFLEKFNGYNVEVSNAFALSFDGEQAQICNLTLHILDNLISKVTGLPQIGYEWFKNKPMEERLWAPFLLRNRQNDLNWPAGVSRLWLKDPWKDIAFLIQKFITCEGRFIFIFLYHIKLLAHLSEEKPLNMPYYLLHSLTKMEKSI